MAQSNHRRFTQRYKVTVYTCSSNLNLALSERVDHLGLYRPSEKLNEQIRDMWKCRKPHVIGSVTESMAKEVLRGARLTIDGMTLALVPEGLRSFLRETNEWKPDRGIFCDDLIAVAEGHGNRPIVLVEVKGTTRNSGLPRSNEAKIFYQLARTHNALARTWADKECRQRHPIAGVITMVVLHVAETITLNVLDEKTAEGFFPDAWMYPGDGHSLVE